MNKLLPLFLLVLCCHSISAAGVPSHGNRFILDAVVRQLFEMFRTIVRNGSEEKEVPVLDPFQINQLSFDTLGPIFRGNINMSKGEFTGLAAFDLQQFNFSRKDISIEVQLFMPELRLKSDDYEMYGTVMDALFLKGKGHMLVELYNITITGKIYLKQSDNGKSILVRRFEKLRVATESIMSDTEFDNNIDKIINRIIEDLGAEYVTKFSRFVSLMYGPIVVQTLNSILNKFENWNIIAVIL